MPDTVGPWWMERRRDADGRLPPAGAGNTAAVNWTAVGALSSPSRALVDPRGYLAIAGASWGLDWWVGADDRWHLPSREPAVRQSLIDSAPLVQTSLRVPGGDVHHRVAAFAGPGGAEIIIEVANDSAAPVALALAVGPVTLLGTGSITEVALVGGVLSIDGTPSLLLPSRPSRALLATGSAQDPLLALLAGEVPEATDATVTCPERRACAVVMVPLAHRATWRCHVALDAIAAGRDHSGRPAGVRRFGLGGVMRTQVPAPPPAAVRGATTGPALDAVARGWRAQVDARVRLELPQDRVTDAVGACRAHLLLAAGRELSGSVADAEVAAAAATGGLGAGDPAALLAGAADEVSLAAALWAADRMVATGAALPSARDVAAAAEAVAARWGAEGPEAGRPASGADPEQHVGWVWAAAGLGAAGGLLRRCGETRAAASAGAWAGRMRQRLPAAAGREAALLAVVLGIVGESWSHPFGPRTGVGLEHVQPLGSEAIEPPLELLEVAALASAGRDWSAPAAALVEMAGPTVAWPDRLTSLGGCGRDGHSALATARLWTAVRTALVDDGEAGPLALLRGWTPGWLGQGLEVHGLPSRWGTVSYAVRWHGERPALLWSVEGAPSDDIVITAPGLDSGWMARSAAGEALLSAPGGAPAPVA